MWCMAVPQNAQGWWQRHLLKPHHVQCTFGLASQPRDGPLRSPASELLFVPGLSPASLEAGQFGVPG